MRSLGEIFGLPIPDAGPIFATALVLHILSGLTAVITGALAATARKRPGRHPRAGRVYLWGLGGIFTTATIMAAIRWHEDAHLFAVAVIAFSLGLYGYRARRHHRPGWPPHHAIGMGGSYIALLTGFYVDNGPFLPLWNRLPHLTYWLLPSLVGIPLIRVALRRFQQKVSHEFTCVASCAPATRALTLQFCPCCDCYPPRMTVRRRVEVVGTESVGQPNPGHRLAVTEIESKSDFRAPPMTPAGPDPPHERDARMSRDHRSEGDPHVRRDARADRGRSAKHSQGR